MKSTGKFKTHLETASKILEKLNAQKERNFFPQYPVNAASTFRTLDYQDIWLLCLRDQYYDIQLYDNSLLQFNVVGNKDSYELRYAYYECPFISMSYEDFLSDSGFDYREVGDEFRNDYENLLLDSKKKDAVTPIRYDYSPHQYNRGTHPASHVHFGHMSKIRLATKYELNPISFVFLVLRQCYPEQWRQFLGDEAAPIWCRNIRDNLKEVDKNFWDEVDNYEMILI